MLIARYVLLMSKKNPLRAHAVTKIRYISDNLLGDSLPSRRGIAGMLNTAGNLPCGAPSRLSRFFVHVLAGRREPVRALVVIVR
jgi:hypothetical protein